MEANVHRAEINKLTPGQKAALSRRLRRVLLEIGERIESEIDKPNYGGCGVIAAIVAENIAAMGVSVEVVTPHHRGDGPAPITVISKLQAKGLTNKAVDAAGLSREHLAVRIRIGRRSFTWDSEGIYPGNAFGRPRWDADGPRYDCKYRFGRGLTVAAAKALADDPKGWNTAFDRDQIPVVRRIVEEAFLH